MKAKILLSVIVLLIFACKASRFEKSVDHSPAPQIINGHEATAQDGFAKHLVAIIISNQATCTGVLVAQDVVLTAAHCLEDVRRGALAFGLNKRKYIVRKIISYKQHESYNPEVEGIANEPVHDLLVVKFSGGLPPGFEPVKWPTESSLLKIGASVLIAGYGRDEDDEYDYLKWAVVQVKDHFEFEFFTDEKNAGSCDGDSGGPVFSQQESGAYLLVGISSRGDMSCRAYGIYEDIFFYKTWIDTALNAI